VPAPLPSERRRTPSGRRRLILIVDDSADTRELYTQYFRFRGFDVITAPDGDAGIEVALRTKPDVMVMDLAMPRVNGISAAHHLKHDPRTRKIPVVLLTGYGLRAIHEGALEMGIDVFLTKPCLPEDLEHHVQGLLDRRGKP
jgi:CheY-like chemotaxis protein